MRVLKYIERCVGASHDGPAWIAHVESSRSGRTIYFDGRALRVATSAGGVGNHVDSETGEPFWVSGVKKSGSNRHWAGCGPILVEASAVDALLQRTGRTTLDTSRFRVIPDLPVTEPRDFVERMNAKA
ncbi:MAG: hypothetical protein AAGE94_01440 [Acidobacteriota bacterium]